MTRIKLVERKIKEYRKFGGKRYKHNITYRSQSGADSQANFLRKQGFSVRIIKGKNNRFQDVFRLYIRRK